MDKTHIQTDKQAGTYEYIHRKIRDRFNMNLTGSNTEPVPCSTSTDVPTCSIWTGSCQ
jgi:hypothetical protein